MQVLVKVYAGFHPFEESQLPAIAQAGSDAITDQEEPWLDFNKDMLTISFEGMYFPLDEILCALQDALPKTAQGKLDYIDLEAWTLTRYTPAAPQSNSASDSQKLVASTRSLNHVLDYSGH